MKEPKVGDYVIVLWHDPTSDDTQSGTPKSILKDTVAEGFEVGGFYMGKKKMADSVYWFLGQEGLTTPKQPEFRGCFRVPRNLVLWWTKIPRKYLIPPKKVLKCLGSSMF